MVSVRSLPSSVAWSSGGMPDGEEEGGVVGVAVLKPEAGGDVRSGEIVGAKRAGTERAAEKEGKGDGKGEPGEEGCGSAGEGHGGMGSVRDGVGWWVVRLGKGVMRAFLCEGSHAGA